MGTPSREKKSRSFRDLLRPRSFRQRSSSSVTSPSVYFDASESVEASTQSRHSPPRRTSPPQHLQVPILQTSVGRRGSGDLTAPFIIVETPHSDSLPDPADTREPINNLSDSVYSQLSRLQPDVTEEELESARKESLLEQRASNPGIVSFGSALCHDCRKTPPSRYCDGCKMSFCPSCWPRQTAHRNKMPDHGDTDYKIAQKIKSCFEISPEEEQRDQHMEDAHTIWFGVEHDPNGEPILEDFGRYASILAEGSLRFDDGARYPGLVCFVGQTGAGKSTLIRLLVELQNPTASSAEAPVVGSVNDSLPTSGDVHLYKDPKSFDTRYPILYADCEGLDGGERDPLGARNRRKDLFGSAKSSSFPKGLRRAYHSSKRELEWARDSQTRKREYIVKHLYPRLLFTFSDVVVFVQNNPRTIESSIIQLVQWADKALEMSSNQPKMPHLVIVMNKTEGRVNAEQWNIKNATRIHLETDISTNPDFLDFITRWRARGRIIQSARDLLETYYSSVILVRTPTGVNVQQTQKQLAQLYGVISNACERSRLMKQKLRWLFNADELQPYLQSAFDHFARNINDPFDFVKASAEHRTISANFADNIFRIAIATSQVLEDKYSPDVIFMELSLLIASSIMLDSVKKTRPGDAYVLFPLYYEACDHAFYEFYDRHWPCEYKDAKGRRCVNVRAGHFKGHQAKDGKVMAFGPYQSAFLTKEFLKQWKSWIVCLLSDLLKQHDQEIKTKPDNALQKAYEIHRERALLPFFRWTDSLPQYISHVSCFSCLMALPEHSLPCGHVICTSCLHGYGRAQGKTLININNCPLHANAGWSSWTVPIIPPGAGVRVLTLDGGGVRGIAELETLRLVEKALGDGIPVQELFDLIVGTSAGGMIALGLGVENWTVDRSATIFSELCDTSFTHRKGVKLYGISLIVQMYFGGIYETRPLEDALTSNFTDANLFGGVRAPNVSNHLTKVAVVATTAAGIRPVVLANYNRTENQTASKSYLFRRSDTPDGELKVWEAARATSAAPTYYKSFYHQESKQEYLDGGLFHNNPVKIADSERKLLWPKKALKDPDIILSVGSGFCPKHTLDRQVVGAVRGDIVRNLKALKNIAVGHIESSLNAQRAWNEWLDARNPDDQSRHRFQRLNASLPYDPPKLDDVASMGDLRRVVREQLSNDNKVQQVAKSLVATLFFFEVNDKSWTPQPGGGHVCTGTIHIRFPPDSARIRAIGEYLRNSIRSSGFRPLFVVEEVGDEARSAFQKEIEDHTLYEMVDHRRFPAFELRVPMSSTSASIMIRLCLSDQAATARPSTPLWSGIPISGFPRKLHDEYRTREPSRPEETRLRRENSISRDRDVPWKASMIDADVLNTPNPLSYFQSLRTTLGGLKRLSMSQAQSTYYASSPTLYELPEFPATQSAELQQTVSWELPPIELELLPIELDGTGRIHELSGEGTSRWGTEYTTTTNSSSMFALDAGQSSSSAFHNSV